MAHFIHFDMGFKCLLYMSIAGIAQIKYRKWVKLPLILNSCLFGDTDESAL